MTRVRIQIETADGLEIDVARDSLVEGWDTRGRRVERELLAECVRRAEQALADGGEDR